MPLTQPVTPRVWIRREDETHARGLLKQWKVDAKIPSEQQ